MHPSSFESAKKPKLRKEPKCIAIAKKWADKAEKVEIKESTDNKELQTTLPGTRKTPNTHSSPMRKFTEPCQTLPRSLKPPASHAGKPPSKKRESRSPSVGTKRHNHVVTPSPPPPAKGSAHANGRQEGPGSHAGIAYKPGAPRSPWKKQKRDQRSLQQSAFRRPKENPFLGFQYDPNNAETTLDALAGKADSVSPGILPPDAFAGSRARGAAHQWSTALSTGPKRIRKWRNSGSDRRGRRRFRFSSPVPSREVLWQKAEELQESSRPAGHPYAPRNLAGELVHRGGTAPSSAVRSVVPRFRFATETHPQSMVQRQMPKENFNSDALESRGPWDSMQRQISRCENFKPNPHTTQSPWDSLMDPFQGHQQVVEEENLVFPRDSSRYFESAANEPQPFNSYNTPFAWHQSEPQLGHRPVHTDFHSAPPPQVSHTHIQPSQSYDVEDSQPCPLPSQFPNEGGPFVEYEEQLLDDAFM